jgi:hypothetical protein
MTERWSTGAGSLPISPMCPIGPIRATPHNTLTALKPVQVRDALLSMTVNDRVDRRRPVTGRYIVSQEGKLQTAATKKPPRLKGRGKSKTTP